MNKIINFHDVTDAVWFENVINILRTKYQVISIDDLYNFYYHNKKLKNTCHITVDDGDISFYDIMYPILKKYKLPATFFVSPKIIKERSNFWFQEIKGYDNLEFKKTIAEYLKIKTELLNNFSNKNILKCLEINQIHEIIDKYRKKYNINSKPPQNINIEQLLELDNSGLITIGAHTLNHPILFNESEISSNYEVTESLNQLKQILNKDIKYFAYPNGRINLDFSNREIDILKNNNCVLAFSTNKDNFSKNDNPMAIPRYGITYGNNNMIKLKLFLGKYWEFIKKSREESEQSIRDKIKKIIFNNSIK